MQQTLTPYQSMYYAWLLTRRAAGDSVESLASTLVDSQVDLNPIRLRRPCSRVQIHYRAASSWLMKWVSAKPSRQGW
jgi:hypothetical protein